MPGIPVVKVVSWDAGRVPGSNLKESDTSLRKAFLKPGTSSKEVHKELEFPRRPIEELDPNCRSPEMVTKSEGSLRYILIYVVGAATSEYLSAEVTFT